MAKEYEIKSFFEYLSKIKEIKEENNGDKIWFRGQSKSERKLVPGILRFVYSIKDKYGEVYNPPRKTNLLRKNGDLFKTLSMSKMIGEFKESLIKKNIQIDSLNDVQIIELSQHYGLPTLLLDWTTDPMVALFFAIGNIQVNDDDLKDNYASVFIINPLEVNKFTFDREECDKLLNSVNDFNEILNEMELAGTFCFEGTKNHPRICRQSGNFTFTNIKNLQTLDVTHQKYIYKINIPYSILKDLKCMLELFDLSNESIYYDRSELDEISNDIREKNYEEFYDELFNKK